MFCKKDVLRNFTKFTGNRLCQSLFFNKVAGLRPVSFVKFLRTPFYIEHLWWLLLYFAFSWIELSYVKQMLSYFRCKTAFIHYLVYYSIRVYSKSIFHCSYKFPSCKFLMVSNNITTVHIIDEFTIFINIFHIKAFISMDSLANDLA